MGIYYHEGWLQKGRQPAIKENKKEKGIWKMTRCPIERFIQAPQAQCASQLHVVLYYRIATIRIGKGISVIKNNTCTSAVEIFH